MEKAFSLFIFLFAATVIFAQQEARLLRFPATNGSQVVFSYAGDLYSVDIKGGIARKLTSDIGYEMFARFSPDGKWIAFSGQYDGNTEVYLMPSNGGLPKRLTFTATLNRDDVSDRMGPNNIVMGWRDNSTIVYRSRQREFNDFKGQLFSVSINGGVSEQLPVPRGGFCSFSADGNKMAYNQVFREFRTWKRYRGGQADDISVYDFTTKSTVKIAENPAQDIIPMWYGNTIYFLSDREQRMNLFSYDLDKVRLKKVTDFSEFDCKFPSIGGGVIVFENGGYIYAYDIAAGAVAKVNIQIADDFDTGRDALIDASKFINTYEISPDGKRALFSARGDVFTVPQKNGPTRNLTQSSGAHDRAPKWSPDGKWIAYISDQYGEDEIYIVPQNGNGKPQQLTNLGDGYKYSLLWSPDGKKILWNDRPQRLQFVDIDSRKITLVDKSDVWEFNNFAWSPDSKWITYTKQQENGFSRVWLYSAEKNLATVVTDEWFGSAGPEFSDDGKYLYFISNRYFSPTYGWTEWNHIYRDMAKLYLIPLSVNVRSPFEPKSDEASVKEPAKEQAKDGAKEKAKDENKQEKSVAVSVDFENIFNRVIEIPVQASNYFNITPAGGKIYYQRRGAADEKTKLFLYDFEAKKETELGDIDGYELSADKKKMLVQQAQSYAIIDAPTAKIDIKEKLPLSDMSLNVNRKAEWKQIFNESWRQMRDFFYAPNMNAVDWKKTRDTYAPLVEYVNHRADLTYIIGEMIGELNAGHAYVGGGDMPKADRVKLGLLGAQISRDAKSGFFRVDKIIRGANWEKSTRSPLTENNVNVKEGDYILAVDGKPCDSMNDIFESLVNTAGKQVTLKVNSTPDTAKSRDVVVVPTDNELDLYYYHWVQENIEKVNRATDGKVGYIHIPDMGPAGLNQFVKMYYPQLRKQALIIDVRGNGGGNVSPMIMERLRRELTMFTVARNSTVNPDPGGMHVGPKVALIDQFSASDGDIFSYRFKFNKTGQTIGKRTWGGVVGIRGSLPFIDGGYLNRPEFSRFNKEATEWIMEGTGVSPDIEIENDPAQEFAGNDQQLNKAIELMLEDLKKAPPVIPNPPPYPDKSK